MYYDGLHERCVRFWPKPVRPAVNRSLFLRICHCAFDFTITIYIRYAWSALFIVLELSNVHAVFFYRVRNQLPIISRPCTHEAVGTPVDTYCGIIVFGCIFKLFTENRNAVFIMSRDKFVGSILSYFTTISQSGEIEWSTDLQCRPSHMGPDARL